MELAHLYHEEWGKLSHFFEEFNNYYWPKDEQEYLFEVELNLVEHPFFQGGLYFYQKIVMDLDFIKDPQKKPSPDWKIGAPRRRKGIF